MGVGQLGSPNTGWTSWAVPTQTKAATHTWHFAARRPSSCVAARTHHHRHTFSTLLPFPRPPTTPDLFVTKFVSVPREMGHLNPAAFVAGIVRGALDGSGFPARCVADLLVRRVLWACWTARGGPCPGTHSENQVRDGCWGGEQAAAVCIRESGTAPAGIGLSSTPGWPSVPPPASALPPCVLQGDGTLCAGARAAAAQDGHSHEVPGGRGKFDPMI